ncbi:PilZ domain-containing protein [Endozoicomonas sp. SCSIO W0465]|uniref:PilZ domain-containing protein n=1 Tax=Endozoicomonas sp. SCSIO W0465 TaxID=2918516 RepID=UPI002075F27B|nr:PilZ domain-containing protein [Endozoicomonas sp. SCSIO W0465]USE34982.1 PilZ domain-containing protein [Endozoicomonas sp. SCSIO W0465]
MSLIPSGKERRSIKRHQLQDYLKIYNRNTMRGMGGIGNISCNGLMLISSVPVLIGAVYNMRIILPDDDIGEQYLDFDARCHWCKPDVGPEYFDSGYSIVNAGHDIIDLVETLKNYFTFAEVAD